MPFSSSTVSSLLSAYAVHRLSSSKNLTKITTSILEKNGPYFIKVPVQWLVKQTVYQHFIGGETLSDLEKTIARLQMLNIGSIIDYAAESDLNNLSAKSLPIQNVKEMYDASSAFRSNPMVRMAVKLSAFFPYSLLKNITCFLSNEEELWHISGASVMERFPEYHQYYTKFATFLDYSAPLPIMIDAERLEIQPALDFIALKAMEKFNRNDGRVMNTYQLYLNGSADRIFAHHAHAKSMGYQFPVKLVRGAYMNADKNISIGRLYGPLFGTVNQTHRNYDMVVKKLLDNITRSNEATGNDLSLLLATHNKNSLDTAVAHENFEFACISKRIACAQLLGMQDGLTESMTSLGMQTFKYVPYGPLDLTIPYLSRRAHENSDAFRGKEELRAIQHELYGRIRKLFMS